MLDLKALLWKILSHLATEVEQITSFNSGWAPYTTGVYPKVRRTGNVVELWGAMTNTSAVTVGATRKTVFNIPAKYRPWDGIYGVVQLSSGTNRYGVGVEANGNVVFERCTNGTSYAPMAAGSWFPFHLIWVIGGGCVTSKFSNIFSRLKRGWCHA